MRTASRLVPAIALLFLAVSGGCGGSAGGGGTDAAFLTADARGFFTGGAAPQPGVAPGAPEAPAADAAGEIAREIEEADLYRVRGDLLFLLNPYRGFAIADLGQARLRGRVPFVGFPEEMYVRGDRALVLLQGFSGDAELLDLDVSDPDAPSLRARLPLAGWLAASRIVGDVLYAVAGGRAFSFSLGTDVAQVDSLALPTDAWTSFVHATDEFLFVAGPGSTGIDTRVTLVDISDPAGDLALRGGLDFPGYLADEFKLHFGAGTLRVVTHDWTNRGLSRLFTVDVSNPDRPQVLGTLALARGEQLFATRFTDEEAFLVTFERVDPLWVIDLRDPARPRIAGELEVPGWSTHIVPVGRQLVALGVDPANGWSVIVSLFDVSDPANPALLSRADFGNGWSTAFSDVKAFGVFPDDGLVLVPFSGVKDRLAVVTLGPDSLALKGWIDANGGVLRGFPHPQGLCALTAEEVVIADPRTLATLATITIAENVVDAARLPDGELVTLVAKGQAAELGGLAVPVSPECLHVSGYHAAVVGWDDAGRAAYVADFSDDPPTLSGRIDLGGGGGPWIPGPWGIGAPVAEFWYGFGPSEAVLTSGGRLYVRGIPAGAADVVIGSGDALDGFTAIDLPSARRLAGVLVRGSFVTGFAASGEDLALTSASPAGRDELGLGLLRHDLVFVDPAAKTATAPVNVPGYLVSLRSDQLFTIEEKWERDYTVSSSVVASRLDGFAVTETGRLRLPGAAYDVRTAGATLFFHTSDGGVYLPFPIDDGGVAVPPSTGGGPGVILRQESGAPAYPDFVPWNSEIGTVRLAATPAFGPSIRYEGSFASLLLAEDGSALVVRDGVAVDRWDVSGASAAKDWSADTGSYPLRARADTVAGQYLVALGYAGLAILP